MALHFILQGLAEPQSLNATLCGATLWEEEGWDLRVDYVSSSSHCPRPVHFALPWVPGPGPQQRWRNGPAREFVTHVVSGFSLLI